MEPQLGDVGTGSERQAATPGEHDDADVRIGPEPVERSVQLVLHPGVDRVAYLGSIERHRGDALADLDLDCLEWHPLSSS